MNGNAGPDEFKRPAPKPALAEQGEPMMRWFSYGHLADPSAQAVSREFFLLATMLVGTFPRTAERTAALRKLLEGKDCAVRCALEARQPP